MKKKIFSLVLALALVLSFSLSALADGGVLDIDVDVEQPTLNVTVPTDLALAFNPLAPASTSGGQAVAGDYYISNQTDGVNVLAAFYLDVTVGQGVTLKAVGDISDNYNLNKEDKDIALGILPALTVNNDTVASYAATTTVKYFDPTAKSVSVGFLLEASDASNAKLATGFSFYSKMNAYAGWAADDISVTGVYLLKALSTETAVTQVNTTLGFIDTAVTALPAKPDASIFPGFPGKTSALLTFTKSAPADLVIPFNAAGGTIKVTTMGGAEFILTTDYTFANGELTVKAAKLSSLYGAAAPDIKTFKIVVTGGTAPDDYIVRVDLKN